LPESIRSALRRLVVASYGLGSVAALFLLAALLLGRALHYALGAGAPDLDHARGTLMILEAQAFLWPWAYTVFLLLPLAILLALALWRLRSRAVHWEGERLRLGPPARALAIGACNSGSSLGAMIAPPLVVFLHHHTGWQGAFLVTGGLGAIWVALFQWFRATHPEMRATDCGSSARRATGPGVPWKELMRYRQTWAVFFCRFFADPMWYFFVFWIPEFLTRERGLSLAGIGAVAWIPFLVSDISNFFTGWVTLRLRSRGWSGNRTRRTLMVAATVVSPIGIAAAFAQSTLWTMVFLCVAIFFWMAWSVTVHTLPGEFFPPHVVASVYGWGGTGSTLGSVVMTWAVGQVLDATHSYVPVFIGIGSLMPIALVVGFALMGRGEMAKLRNYGTPD